MNDYSINRFFYIIDYKVIEGCRYLWKCYGDNAWGLTNSCGNCFKFTHEVDVVFDRKTLIIYEVICYDYDTEINYRWIHPNYREKYEQEAKERGVDPNISYGDVKYIDVSSFEEWESKAREVINKYE